MFKSRSNSKDSNRNYSVLYMDCVPSYEKINNYKHRQQYALLQTTNEYPKYQLNQNYRKSIPNRDQLFKIYSRNDSVNESKSNTLLKNKESYISNLSTFPSRHYDRQRNSIYSTFKMDMDDIPNQLLVTNRPAKVIKSNLVAIPECKLAKKSPEGKLKTSCVNAKEKTAKYQDLDKNISKDKGKRSLKALHNKHKSRDKEATYESKSSSVNKKAVKPLNTETTNNALQLYKVSIIKRKENCDSEGLLKDQADLKSQNTDLIAQIQNLNSKLILAETKLNKANKQYKEVNSKLSDANEELKEKSSNIKRKRKECKEAKSKIKMMEENYSKLNNELSLLSKENEELNKNLIKEKETSIRFEKECEQNLKENTRLNNEAQDLRNKLNKQIYIIESYK